MALDGFHQAVSNAKIVMAQLDRFHQAVCMEFHARHHEENHPYNVGAIILNHDFLLTRPDIPFQGTSIHPSPLTSIYHKGSKEEKMISLLFGDDLNVYMQNTDWAL